MDLTITLISAVIESPYSKIMSMITKSTMSAFGLQLSDGSVMLFDAYTCRDIPGIDDRDDLWSSNLVKHITLTTHSVANINSVDADCVTSISKIKRLIDGDPVNLSTTITNRKSPGDQVWGRVMSMTGKLVGSSKTSIAANHIEVTKTNKFFNDMLTELFSLLPRMINNDPGLFVLLFHQSIDIDTNCDCNAHEVISLFPSIDETLIVDRSLRQFIDKITIIRSGINDILRSLEDLKHINAELLRTGLNSCCSALNIRCNVNLPMVSTVSSFIVGGRMRMDICGSSNVIELPMYGADVSSIPTNILCNIIVYFNSLPINDDKRRGDVLTRIIKEVASRKSW